MNNNEEISLLVLAIAKYPDLANHGENIGKLYTDHGLPLEIVFSKLRERSQLNQLQQIALLHHALQWLIKHKRDSSATEKALDRQRLQNRRILQHFIKTGEIDEY